MAAHTKHAINVRCCYKDGHHNMIYNGEHLYKSKCPRKGDWLNK